MSVGARKGGPDRDTLRLVEHLRFRLSHRLHGHMRVVLFGSHARGEASPESDIDVLVVVEALSRESEDIIYETAWEVGFDAGTVLSIVPATFDELQLLKESPFYRAIEAEGIAV